MEDRFPRQLFRDGVQFRHNLSQESRNIRMKAVGHLALLSSGAIIVSVNALGPIEKITGTLICFPVLEIAWFFLATATISTVVIREQLSSLVEMDSRDLDEKDSKLKTKFEIRTSSLDRRMKYLRWVMWVTFLTGMVLLLLFVSINLHQIPLHDLPTTQPASR